MVDWLRIQSIEDLEFGRKYLFRPEFLPLLFSYIGVKSGILALDMGCGTGSFHV
ncbi:MAG: hypothetical protein ACE5KD_00765 [Candidatus Bathyarchaeia archaeon]